MKKISCLIAAVTAASAQTAPSPRQSFEITPLIAADFTVNTEFNATQYFVNVEVYSNGTVTYETTNSTVSNNTQADSNSTSPIMPTPKVINETWADWHDSQYGNKSTYINISDEYNTKKNQTTNPGNYEETQYVQPYNFTGNETQPWSDENMKQNRTSPWFGVSENGTWGTQYSFGKTTEALIGCIEYTRWDSVFDQECGKNYCDSHHKFFHQECANAYQQATDIFNTCKSEVDVFKKLCDKEHARYSSYYPPPRSSYKGGRSSSSSSSSSRSSSSGSSSKKSGTSSRSTSNYSGAATLITGVSMIIASAALLI